MMEFDCVAASLEQIFEVGKSSRDDIVYIKTVSGQSLEEMERKASAWVGAWVQVKVLRRKQHPTQGNVLLIRLIP